MTELRECPFCGGAKISMKTYDIASDCFVMCCDCGALIERDVSWGKPEDNGNVGFMSKEERVKKYTQEQSLKENTLQQQSWQKQFWENEKVKKMIWPNNVSFEGYSKKKYEFFKNTGYVIGDPPIEAQYALDLLFKTLIDDKENFEFLTTVPESTEQTNYIMLELLLRKYSRKYRKYLKRRKKNG